MQEIQNSTLDKALKGFIQGHSIKHSSSRGASTVIKILHSAQDQILCFPFTWAKFHNTWCPYLGSNCAPFCNLVKREKAQLSLRTSKIRKEDNLGHPAILLGHHRILEGASADETLERQFLIITAHLIVFIIYTREEIETCFC